MNPIEQRFLRFHEDNPHVYVLFDHFAREAVASGASRYSAYAVVNRIRWHTTIETVGSVFKISNDFIPHLARLWLREHPEHKDFFITHALKHEKHPELELEPVSPPV